MVTAATIQASQVSPVAPDQLCARAARGLQKMYCPQERLFCHSLRLAGGQLRQHGVSRRYTATVLLGLSRASAPVRQQALGGRDVDEMFDRLRGDLEGSVDPGEVALTLWAARAWGHPAAGAARDRLRAMRPESADIPMVELAWCLSATAAQYQTPGDSWLAGELARRIIASAGAGGLFPHWPAGVPRPWLRAPICCFADQVYPIQALSLHHLASGHRESLSAGRRCGRVVCRLQGRHGQWWWHYDVRTARVVEGYPVYSVHQDAMAPMALAALSRAGGEDTTEPIRRGLAWLAHADEIDGSLIDPGHDVIWRKVARHEPGRLVRGLQAVACRIHSALRVPGIGQVFRPGWIDRETRPYHLGWILFAWAEASRTGSQAGGP